MEEILQAVLEMMLGVTTKNGIIQAQGEIESEGKSYVWTFNIRETTKEDKG